MKTKQTIRNLVVGAILVLSFFAPATLLTEPTYANTKCGGVETSIINCDQDNTDKDGDKKVSEKETGLWGLLLIAVNLLTAGVGVLALGGIVYGAVLYTSAGGNPEQVKKARTIFFNVAIGIAAFAGMYALLNFIIPGGAFNLL